MALKPPIKEKLPYAVEYRSSSQTPGSTYVAAQFIRKRDEAQVTTNTMVVAPAGSDELGGDVPSADDVWRLEVIVHLPDGMGAGTLTVRQNATVIATGLVTGDEKWVFIVV